MCQRQQRGGHARNHRVSGLVQRRANRRCAGLSRSVQRPKGAGLSAGLGVIEEPRSISCIYCHYRTGKVHFYLPSVLSLDVLTPTVAVVAQVPA